MNYYEMLIRDDKLSTLTNTKPDPIFRGIIDYFNNIFNGVVKRVNCDCVNLIEFFKDDMRIIEINKNCVYFYIHEEIWDFLYFTNGFNYKEIDEFIKLMVNYKLNFKIPEEMKVQVGRYI